MSLNRFKRRQRVLRLDTPYLLVQPDAQVRDLWRSQIPVRAKQSLVLAYVERGVVLGYVQARRGQARSDEWTITTLAAVERASGRIMEALVEQACREAGQAGVLRILVKVPEEHAALELFHGTGFTHYTNESIWGNLYFSQQGVPTNEPPHDPIRRQQTSDAWDLLRLYSAVTPPVVQRAENISSREWQRSSLPRPAFPGRDSPEKGYIWPSETDKESLGGYVRLLSGKGGHWISLLFRADTANRAVLPRALDYVLWKASRQSSKPVYCGVRDYQVEAEGELEDRGFHLLSKQVLLVKYMAEPIKVRRPALVPFWAPKTPVTSR